MDFYTLLTAADNQQHQSQNGYNSVTFIDNELRLVMVVAESHRQQILQLLTHFMKSQVSG